VVDAWRDDAAGEATGLTTEVVREGVRGEVTSAEEGATAVDGEDGEEVTAPAGRGVDGDGEAGATEGWEMTGELGDAGGGTATWTATGEVTGEVTVGEVGADGAEGGEVVADVLAAGELADGDAGDEADGDAGDAAGSGDVGAAGEGAGEAA
jgi:hypothetical protein